MPERFDSNGGVWTLTADGKPRNPLAFTPFMGGKRVCLGKTFTEVTTRFTIPLLYYFFDFEFVSPSQADHKALYAVGGKEELKLPVKLI